MLALTFSAPPTLGSRHHHFDCRPKPPLHCELSALTTILWQTVASHLHLTNYHRLLPPSCQVDCQLSALTSSAPSSLGSPSCGRLLAPNSTVPSTIGHFDHHVDYWPSPPLHCRFGSHHHYAAECQLPPPLCRQLSATSTIERPTFIPSSLIS